MKNQDVTIILKMSGAYIHRSNFSSETTYEVQYVCNNSRVSHVSKILQFYVNWFFWNNLTLNRLLGLLSSFTTRVFAQITYNLCRHCVIAVMTTQLIRPFKKRFSSPTAQHTAHSNSSTSKYSSVTTANLFSR